jgi:hypothetical protein
LVTTPESTYARRDFQLGHWKQLSLWGLLHFSLGIGLVDDAALGWWLAKEAATVFEKVRAWDFD